MKQVKLLCSLACILFLFQGSLSAQDQVYMTQEGHAEFISEVPLHTFTGESDHLVGKIALSDSIIDFYVDLNTIETGIAKRDKDMRETLEVKKYPFAEFYGKLVSDFDTSSSEVQDARVQGTFKVHGISKEVTIDGTLQMTDEGLRVKASWTLNLNDYNIEPPGILFYRVDKNQDITIEALLKPTGES